MISALETANSPVHYVKVYFEHEGEEMTGFIRESYYQYAVSKRYSSSMMNFCEVVFSQFGIVKNRINNAIVG